MAKPNKIIRDWLREALPHESALVAKKAQTSVNYLRHVAAGRRGMSAEMAQRLAHASEGLAPSLQLQQRYLCEACTRCPLLKAER